jgi:hypothetical protein
VLSVSPSWFASTGTSLRVLLPLVVLEPSTFASVQSLTPSLSVS